MISVAVASPCCSNDFGDTDGVRAAVWIALEISFPWSNDSRNDTKAYQTIIRRLVCLAQADDVEERLALAAQHVAEALED